MNDAGEQVLIAANPMSGAASSHRRVAELRSALSGLGYRCEVLHSLEQIRRDSMSLHEAGRLRAVVSAGGDGTADALANLLPPHIPLLIFPLGTENLLAKHLGITGDVRQACEILQGNRRLSLDVGSANGKLFLVMLSCGFDAEVVRHMHAARTGHINRWSYTRPIWTSLRRYRFPQLRFDWELSKFETHLESEPLERDRSPATDPFATAAWLFVFNIPRYAASLDFCPQADPSDGLLDVCLFKRSGIAPGLGYLTRLWLGSHQQLRGFQHRRCRRLSIATPADKQGRPLDIPYQIDGDPGGVLPLEIQVLPARLTLLVPPR